MVICHAATRTYAVQGDVRRNGRHVRTVRMKIDRCDRIGLREARRRARELMSQIQAGVDPTAVPKTSAMTLGQAFEAHLANRELRPTTVALYKDQLARYLRSVRGKAIADLSRQDVRYLFEDLKVRHGQTAAAGAMRTLKAVINTAMRIDETITSRAYAVEPARGQVQRLSNCPPYFFRPLRHRADSPQPHLTVCHAYAKLRLQIGSMITVPSRLQFEFLRDIVQALRCVANFVLAWWRIRGDTNQAIAFELHTPSRKRDWIAVLFHRF
jgi:hypothetical protein